MHRRRRISLILVLLLLGLVGVPCWFTYNQIERDQASRALIRAIKRQDTAAALAALDAGADPNTRDAPGQDRSLGQYLRQFLASLRGLPSSSPSEGPTAVFLAVER